MLNAHCHRHCRKGLRITKDCIQFPWILDVLKNLWFHRFLCLLDLLGLPPDTPILPDNLFEENFEEEFLGLPPDNLAWVRFACGLRPFGAQAKQRWCGAHVRENSPNSLQNPIQMWPWGIQQNPMLKVTFYLLLLDVLKNQDLKNSCYNSNYSFGNIFLFCVFMFIILFVCCVLVQ